MHAHRVYARPTRFCGTRKGARPFWSRVGDCLTWCRYGRTALQLTPPCLPRTRSARLSYNLIHLSSPFLHDRFQLLQHCSRRRPTPFLRCSILISLPNPPTAPRSKAQDSKHRPYRVLQCGRSSFSTSKRRMFSRRCYACRICETLVLLSTCECSSFHSSAVRLTRPVS